MGYYEDKKEELQRLLSLLEDKKKKLKMFSDDIIKLAKEKAKGFPTLSNVYDEYFTLKEDIDTHYLLNKSHPAEKTANEIKNEYSKKIKALSKEMIYYKYIVEYYEWIAPFLLDCKNEEFGGNNTTDEIDTNADYTDEEKQDYAIKYLKKEEYRLLPNAEKYQLALDRYWKRPHSNIEIGKMFERYIGYIYENLFYDVEFKGIIHGFEDLGRDLICKKENDIVIIQCKYWSKFKTIHEKHIFQFFGTVFQYKYENPSFNVRPYFYTTTEVSDLARRFSNELNITIKDNFPFDKTYPCIKCNISRSTNEKIYHLPFDQMYDKIKIEIHKGECYSSTIEEAESKGFRRAKRYYKPINV